MAQLPYEILFRWNDDGKFSGAHTITRDPSTGRLGQAVALGKDPSFPLPDALKAIDTALAAKASEADALQKELDAVKSERDQLFSETLPGKLKAAEAQAKRAAAVVEELKAKAENPNAEGGQPAKL